MADANTGAAGTIRVNVSESGQDAANNRSTVNWSFQLIERVTSNYSWANGVSASVSGLGSDPLWSGTFNFDWRAAGNQTVTIASGSKTLNHNANGTGSVTVTGNMGATGTSGAGGPASVAQSLTLTTLVQKPGSMVNLSATRSSDTAIALSWGVNYPSNGVPTNMDLDVAVNNAAYANKATLGNVRSYSAAVSANQKLTFRIRQYNSAGYSGFYTFPTVYTTPAAPTGVTASKQTNGDIVIKWTNKVAYNEHNHTVWHGTMVGSTITWDAAALTTLGYTANSYTHSAPDPSKIHVYRVKSGNTSGGLSSAYVQSNSVQLTAPPNAPTVAALAATADKALPLSVAFTHNPVDSSDQTAYEFEYSKDGGATWTTTGKVVSTDSTYSVPANTFTSNQVGTFQVRTWGAATTAGSDGTGASPWSNPKTVTFKTEPVATIVDPADGSETNDSSISIDLGFTQAEGATFVKAQLELYTDELLLEQDETVALTDNLLGTVLDNNTNYTVRARVQDSNGLWSDWASNDFSVVYLSPVPAEVGASYQEDQGYGQIDIYIPDPDDDQEEVATLNVTRTIDGVTETVARDYPYSQTLSIIDQVPTISGTNTYTVTTVSALGATSSVTVDLVTNELRRAFLNKGTSYASVGVFGGNLSVDEDVSVANDTLQAAGRTKPIGLYGMETSVSLKVQSYIFEGFGSTIPELRSLLLMPGKACYRDASGRRVVGAVKGTISYKMGTRATLSFTITEAD